MFKRVIKIILILLGAFLLTLLIIWLVQRGKAEKASQTPLSFKQFLGLSTAANYAQTVPGEISSIFTGGSGTNGGSSSGGSGSGTNGSGGNINGGGVGNGNLGSGGNINGGNLGNGNNGSGGNPLDTNPDVSQFTNGGINPSGGVGSIAGSGEGVGGIGGTGNSSSSTNSSNTNGNTSSATTDTTECSEEDTNIDFTPEEISELNELQNRFYTVAQTLHTDADVAIEVANHDAFAVKADQDVELYNYCESKIPLITDPRLQQRVATPFWSTDSDSLSMLNFGANSGLDAAHLEDIHDNNTADPNSPDTSGVKGPYGLLNFSAPVSVPINGSVLKTNSVTSITGPLGLGPSLDVAPGSPGGTVTTRPPDYQLLVPVVERILRINLW